MVLVMENQSYNQIIGNSSAPYINLLADRYLRATNSYARGHYSLPNYLEMISGQAYEASGTANDCTPPSCGPVTGTNVTDQLAAAGIRWMAFMGAMPSDCDTSDAGGSGGYGVRHDPFVYFPQGRKNPACGNDVPSGRLLSMLNSPTPPDFVFYSPSICDRWRRGRSVLHHRKWRSFSRPAAPGYHGDALVSRARNNYPHLG